MLLNRLPNLSVGMDKKTLPFFSLPHVHTQHLLCGHVQQAYCLCGLPVRARCPRSKQATASR
ncbi:hypothetical protein KFZ76_21945 [Methylovulum psychrotolerans]|uniref:hypothetical protein n=1 Tax=Methylovulum psychrotolerans TaxID=1704499 RepID=UPI001BFF44B1|nr:hypothetical protein [Methylovulum psychrotolerans]MBT9100362.1 hypothetical protein [Methylovulum psychrotolerans]